MDGYFWWQTVTSSNLSNFDIPSWVKYNLDADGYYYIDPNNLPFEIVTQNIFEETISEYSSILDTGYQNPEKTVPNNLFTDRIESLDSSDLPQGLYLEKLTFSTLSEHTEDASETFYTFGYDGFEQGENDYSLFVGIDSKFAENITVSVKGKSYDLPLVNGCAILQTSALAPNAEGAILITVNSFEKSNSYQRSLINAGSYDGRRHQQLLIIDRDFDGIEDLYDSDVDSSSIEVAYQNYKNAYPNHRKGNNFFTVEVEGTTGGTIETIGFASGDAVKSGSVLTIRAKPDESYVFNGWSGDLVSPSIEANITIVKDMVITGSFTEAKNYFSLNILTTEGGEIKEIEDLNGKKVEGGTTLKFTAQSDQGYEFTGWTTSLGQFPSSQNPLSITVNENTTLQANFSQPQKLPTISRVEEGINLTFETQYTLSLKHGDRYLYYGGHAEGSALVDYDAFDLDGTETLRGRFTEYDEDGEFVRDYAWFEIKLTDYPPQDKVYYTLEFIGSEGGVIIDPTTQEIYGDGLFNSVIVIAGTIIEVEAQSDQGYEFTGWTTSLGQFPSSQNPLSITVNEDTTLQANFSQPQKLPTISRVEEGINLTFEPQYSLSLKHGDRYLYYGGHAEGSALVDYDAFGLDGTETLRGRFTEYDEDGEFVRDYAWFEIKLTDYPPPLKAYHALEFIGSEGGVIIDPNTQEIHSDGLLNSVMMVIAGTTIEVEAQPDQGYEFTGWTSSLGQFPSSQNPLSITLNENTTLQANFSQPQKLPTISRVEEGINLTFETQYTLSLKHEDRYLYYGGHAEGSALVDYDAFDLDGTETLRGRFTEYDEDGEFVRDYAWFEIKLTDYPPPLKAYHALEFIGSEGGVIIDPNTQEIHSDGLLNSVMMVIAGTTIEVEAQPDQGYEFTGWTSSLGQFPSSQNPLSITVNEDTTLQANFSQPQKLPTISRVEEGINLTFEPQYTLSLKHEDRYLYYGGHAEGSALVDYDAFDLDGTETLRGRFTEYDEDGEFVRDYAWFEIKLTDYPPQDKVYYTLEFIGSEGGVIIDPNTQEIHSDGLLNSVMMVIAGTTIEVEAQPDQGYEFTGWTSSLGQFPSSQNPLSITLNENTTLQANFSQPQKLPTISRVEEGINLTFDTQYTLSLKHEDRYLYYGGHAEGSALVDYDAFDLDGTETLRGRFTEYDEDGEFVRDYAWFEIKLTDYPPPLKAYHALEFIGSEGGVIIDPNTQEIHSDGLLNSVMMVIAGTIIEVEAQPDQGYEFTGWTSSLGQFPSSQNPLSITVNENTTLQANFSQPQKLPTISRVEEGINLTFDTQYTLSLKHEDRYLYYGGHAEGSALVDYDAFDLDGTETLRGRFTEYDEDGEFVRDFAWFEIKLTDYPPPLKAYHALEFIGSEGGVIIDPNTQEIHSDGLLNSVMMVIAGTIIEVEAQPDQGYEFTGWTSSLGQFPSSQNPLSITVNEDTTLQANFSQPQKLPTISRVEEGINLTFEPQYTLSLKHGDRYLYYGGHAEGSALVDYDAFDLDGTETLRGRFTEYDEDGEFVRDYAWFEIKLTDYPPQDKVYYTLEFIGSEGGVIIDPTTQEIYGDGLLNSVMMVIAGTIIEVEAQPDQGYEFTGWTTSLGQFPSSQNPLSITVNEDTTLQANFSQPQKLPTISRVEEGINLTFEPQYTLSLKHGDRYLYYGGHAEGSALVDYDAFDLDGTETLRGRFTEYDEDGEFVRDYAWFEIKLTDYPPQDKVYYTLEFIGSEGGVIIDPTTQEIYGDGLLNSVMMVIAGTIIEVEAQPDQGYEFTGWTTSLGQFPSSQNPLSITVNENTTLQANFSQPQKLPTISRVEEGINLTFDTQYTLSLKHEDRYLYYGGHAEGSALVDYDAFGLDGTETLRGRFTEYDEDGEFVRDYAWFEIKLTDYPPPLKAYHALEFIGSEGGVIIDPTTQEIYGDGLFNSVIVIEGTIIEVEAQSNEGYEFTGWTSSLGQFPSSQNPLSITVNENTTLQANFSQPQKLPTISRVEEGINLTFEPQYTLSLKHGDRYLYYGGHAEGSALVDYDAFGLDGTETLRGRFTEYDETGEFVRDYAWFEIKLTDYPPRKVPKISKVEEGIVLEWESETPEGSIYSKYILTLVDNERTLYDGGHLRDSALVDYQVLGLSGTEILRGRFTEYDYNNGEFVREFDWFEINLSYCKSIKDAGIEIGNQWRDLNWFGVFFPGSNGWHYHIDHGWIFPSHETLYSIWYWHTEIGWCWTNVKDYPYIYSNKFNSWLFYREDSKKYYNYANEDWFKP